MSNLRIQILTLGSQLDSAARASLFVHNEAISELLDKFMVILVTIQDAKGIFFMVVDWTFRLYLIIIWLFVTISALGAQVWFWDPALHRFFFLRGGIGLQCVLCRTGSLRTHRRLSC